MLKKLLSICISLILVSAIAAVFCSCGTSPTKPVTDNQAVSSTTASAGEKATEATAAESPEESDEATTTEKLIDGMRPEFKAAMDSYESFMNEYVEFMEKYLSDPEDLSLLLDYTDYMSKYSDFVKDFEKWEDDEEMNTAETAYYIEVQARVGKKLLKVTK